MTDTIGWGEVDERPRRLPRMRLNRRRRIALIVVAALVAGGIVAWPSFKSWRADAAAREVQRIWARAQGFDNARVLALSGIQPTLNPLDRPAFARLVVALDVEEAADLDRLTRQAKAMRTWSADVATARKAVVAALVAQAAGLRNQARRPGAITIDISLTTWIDGRALAAADVVDPMIDVLRSRHHLKPLGASTERFHSTSALLAALRRPTDDLLHLRLIAAGPDGMTITDLDTGHVVVRRTLDTGDPLSWQPQRLFGRSLVASVDGGTVLVPLSNHGSEHFLRDIFVQSSLGSPMWLASLVSSNLHAVDESGRTATRVIQPPGDLLMTGVGNGSVLVAMTRAPEDFNDPNGDPRFFLFVPGTGRLTEIPTTGCPQLPALGGGVVAIATGNTCEAATQLELFDLSARLLRTAKIPGREFLRAQPIYAPDGKHIAVSTTPNYDPNVTVPTTIRVLDTATGAWTAIAGSDGWLPIGWSSDGSTLLLQRVDTSDFAPGQQIGPLAYTRLDDPTMHSVRVAADFANYLS